MRSYLRRVLRTWGYDRNPMRRPIDRLETVVTTAIVVLALIVVPLATALISARVYANGLHAERVQNAGRYEVDATVASPATVTTDSSGNDVSQVVTVVWHTPAGAAGKAVVPELPGDRVGGHRMLWVDHSGQIVGRPRDRAQTVSDTVLAGMFALTGVALPFAGAHALLRRRLERKRMAQWEADWRLTAPRWIRNG